MKDFGRLNELEKWYKNHCNGDWEHTYGLKICTIDNPGWSVIIDLMGTELEDEKLKKKVIQGNDESNWIIFEAKGSTFYGYGGVENLSDILASFLDWHHKVVQNRGG